MFCIGAPKLSLMMSGGLGVDDAAFTCAADRSALRSLVASDSVMSQFGHSAVIACRSSEVSNCQ